MWRLAFAVPSWIVMFLLQIPLYIIGWVAVPIAVLSGAYEVLEDHVKEDKGENPLVYHFTWDFMRMFYDNWEDGFANDMYYKAPNLTLQAMYWSCYRNPINNLRRVPYVSCKPDADRVKFRGSLINLPPADKYDPMCESYIRKYDTKVPQWFFAWQGFYTTWYWQFKVGEGLYRIWIGWKIYPDDIYRTDFGYRKYGSTCTYQIKRVK